MNLGSVIIVCVRSKNFSRGRIVEANCILESTPPPHFGLDVVYKMGGGGVLTGHYGNSYVEHCLILSKVTVEYAQVCCSVLVSILITNYMMLDSGSMVYSTEAICCWSALVQYDLLVKSRPV